MKITGKGKEIKPFEAVFCPECKPDFTGKTCYCDKCFDRYSNQLCEAISSACYQSQK